LLLPAQCTTNDRQLEAGPAADTRESGLSAAELAARAAAAAVVPDGSVVAGSQSAFLRAVDEHPATVLLRVDALEHMRAVAWVLATTASWSTLTTRPTWPVLIERTGLSRSTVARWLRWLRQRDLLAIVESGTTPQFAPMALAADAANRAALYVLCVPASPAAAVADLELGDELPVVEISLGRLSPVSVDESDTPTFLLLNVLKNPHAGARGTTAEPVAASLVADQERSDKRGTASWPRHAVAGTRADRLDLVEALQASAPALRPASARALRSELRPWLERSELGWTVRWLLHALDHTPDGRPHPFTAAVRVPVHWLRHRMSLWLDEHGQPLPAPGVQHDAARAAERAATAAAVDERRVQARQLEHGQDFAGLIRDVAGSRYPGLVAAVLERDLPEAGRKLLPAAAAEAMTREAVRALVGDVDHATAEATDPEFRHAVTAAVGRLLGDDEIRAAFGVARHGAPHDGRETTPAEQPCPEAPETR
jgi:hypothetical protein